MKRLAISGLLACIGLVACTSVAQEDSRPAAAGSESPTSATAGAETAGAETAGAETRSAETRSADAASGKREIPASEPASEKAAAKAEPSRWEETIRKFEAEDRESPPPRGAILFVGSSSIRMWKTARDFAELSTINRGFGGSEMSDVVEFLDRIVLPYAPRDIFLYEGDNDIAKGKTAERVHADYRKFVAGVHARLPEARIHFIAIKPSLARWNLVETMRAANALVRADTEKDPRLGYLDIDTPMLGADGKPRPELFLDDGLHLSEKGYAIWNELVRGVLASHAADPSGGD